MMLRIDIHRWFAMAIQIGCQNTKSFDLGEIWFPSRLWCCELISIVGLLWRFKLAAKIQNPPIWAKFVFQVDYDVANWYPSLVCYGGHFESKMAAKIQKSSRFGFQVDFDVGNWYPWFGSHIMIHFVGKSTVVCGSFWGGWTNSKWRPLPW